MMMLIKVSSQMILTHGFEECNFVEIFVEVELIYRDCTGCR